MNENIKKIGKIIGIGLIIFVLFVVVLGFLFSNRTVMTSTDYSYDLAGSVESGSLGLGSSNVALFGGSSKKQEPSSDRFSKVNESSDAMTDKKIIKDADLSIYVDDAEKAVERIKRLTLSLNGFVSNSQVYENSQGYKYGNITIRVPAENFEKTIHNVKELAREVERENISAKDVTEQYIDLEAQIRNLRAEEAQYLKIMEKSETVEDTLNVAGRLSDVRGRIEQIEGKFKYLSRQIEMSTIRINLEADADLEVFGLRWRPLIVAKRALRNMISSLTDYIDTLVTFIIFLPVIIIWAVSIITVLLIILKILVWVHKKFIKKPDSY